MGDGFPVLAYRRMDVIMAACGVAICAMHAVIDEILSARSEWNAIHVFYGERTADRFAFIEERERWREVGIDVHLAASRPAEGTYFRGFAGYVQDCILETLPETSNTVAFVAGKDAMVDGVRASLERLYLPSNRIILNY
jgi:NAD(P)H-flavin reductase